jgi:DNA-binding NtrC family response regulator
MSSPSIAGPPAPAPLDTRAVPARPAPQDEITRLLAVNAVSRGSLRILVIDDERTLRESCTSLLQSQGYNVAAIGRGDEALQALKTGTADIVLIDLYMSPVSGLALLRAALDARPDAIVIMMTGKPSVNSSVEVLRAGAWDYVPKPFSATHLQILIGRAAHTVLVARETRDLQKQLEQAHGNSEKVTVLGTAPAFRRVIGLARRVAPTDASVFITGESGSGKELIAQFIHHHSRRSSRPLVAINCAALPEPLLESEMFGHCKGAFTGAVRDKPGLLETANGGTLFLDELIEMSKPIQAKLLRVIQDGVVRRVGSETTDAIVNVRFIAATNQIPEDAVRSSALREDLYYRLRVVPIHVPALRERPDDIPLLTEHFFAYYWNRHRGAKAALPKFTDAALDALRSHSWPGNVRELQNVIEHAVVLLEPGADVGPPDIPFITSTGQRAVPPTAPGALIGSPAGEKYYASRDRMLAEFDRQYLVRLVQLAGGNMSKAARLAGIDRTTLYRLMERQGMQRDTEGIALTEEL